MQGAAGHENLFAPAGGASRPVGSTYQMTRTNGIFPIAIRAALLLAAMLFVAGAGVSSASPRSERDAAKRTFEAAKDELGRIQGQIDQIEADLAVKAEQVDAAEAVLDATITELFRVRESLEKNQARFDEISERLNARAVEAYINGPGTSLDFLLGATSLADLSDRFEYVDAVARDDADLAQEVQSRKNLLLAQQAELARLRSEHRKAVERARVARDGVIATLDRAQGLYQRQQSIVGSANRRYKKALRDYQASLRTVSFGGSNVPLPDGYAGVLQVCPVGQPRSYWDGFGAPRYAGGYHLHKGVDMLAPSGTPIFAPFAGQSYTSSNGLGGKVVFVVGRYGSVYNAHLSGYSSSSSGTVQAGDVIGYVGDTGDAIGLPHLHFEFHPNVIPASWPASSYGYSVIEDAVNPYPLLLHACG